MFNLRVTLFEYQWLDMAHFRRLRALVGAWRDGQRMTREVRETTRQATAYMRLPRS